MWGDHCTRLTANSWPINSFNGVGPRICPLAIGDWAIGWSIFVIDRKSHILTDLSVPPEAITVDLYLFQSTDKASNPPWAVNFNCNGFGLRTSQTCTCDPPLQLTTMEGECGENWAEYMQLAVFTCCCCCCCGWCAGWCDNGTDAEPAFGATRVE